jgi:DNA-binding GntR family transcriptional regulator
MPSATRNALASASARIAWPRARAPAISAAASLLDAWPGEHLREADVARWLNISRTPVREAFHRIITEGLLINGPWNGVMIAELSADQLVQLYAVREVLEGSAAALAAQHATKAELQLLFKIVATEASEKGNPDRLVTINGELHQTLYAAAHNSYLLQSLNSIVDALGLLRHSTFVLPGSIELAHREHLQIIRAIRDHKPADAGRLARAHVRHALAMRLELQNLRLRDRSEQARNTMEDAAALRRALPV